MPALYSPLVNRCVASLAPQVRERLIVVDNSGQGVIARELQHKGLLWTVQASENSVPRAWNIGVRSMRNSHSEWLVCISQSDVFGDAGGLDVLGFLAESSWTVVHSQYGWHCTAVHCTTFDRVGVFDPLFSP